MGFDKFAWIKAVAADRHIPEGQRFVLVYYALVYVRHGEEVVCVRQETIAQRCATSLSTVRRAMAGARARGYLVLAEPRQRGRGHQRADAYRLVIPATEIGANLTPIPGIGVKNNQNRGQKPPEYRSKVTEIGVNANSLTSENDTPKGLYKGLDKGGGKGTADAAPPPPQNLEDQKTDSEGAPSPYCRRHQPDGTEAPCFACGQARQRHQAAQAEAERHAAEAARVAEISRCNQCDQHGWWGEPGLASYEDLDGSAQTRAETLTPMAFVPPERTDELPAYLHNWLTECTTDGLTWWALKCQHGTSDPDDPRYIGGTVLSAHRIRLPRGRPGRFPGRRR
ncbi:MAG: hypothetical protein ACXVX6_05325 [Mycobacterium sp.]